MSDEKYFKRRMEENGNDPTIWAHSAADLLISAGRLREILVRSESPSPCEIAVLSPFLMLRGMAVECLLKAVAAKKGHVFVKNCRYQKIPGVGDHHDLVRISQSGAVDVTFTTDDQALLRRLSHFVRYAGRYPIPTSWEEGLAQNSKGSKYLDTRWRMVADEKRFQSLIARLFAEVGVTRNAYGLVIVPQKSRS